MMLVYRHNAKLHHKNGTQPSYNQMKTAISRCIVSVKELDISAAILYTD